MLLNLGSIHQSKHVILSKPDRVSYQVTIIKPECIPYTFADKGAKYASHYKSQRDSNVTFISTNWI
jgi:hypothetical protein